MKRLPTEVTAVKVDRVHNSIYRILTPFGEGGVVYLYLVKGDRIALIDTGAAQSPAGVLQPALAEIGISLSDVDLILNTHAHLDHAGGNLETKRVSDASIYVHSADLFMANSTDAQVEFMTAPLRVLDYPAGMVQQRADYVVRMAGESAGADVTLSDGDTVDLGAGIVLRTVHCPGHTPGHVCYYWESEGVLLTGDALQGQGSRPGGYPFYFAASDYRRSLSKLMELDIRLLCMSHSYLSGVSVNEPTKAGADGKAFIQESAQVADTMHRAVVEAVQQNAGASKREIALSAMSELIYQIPAQLVRETRMPYAAGPTLLTHIEAALDNSYPA